jgi:hypothetical protein
MSQPAGVSRVPVTQELPIHSPPRKFKHPATIIAQAESELYGDREPVDMSASFDDDPSPHVTFEDEPVVHVTEEKAKFLEDLRAFATRNKKKIDPVVKVGGRNVELYKFWLLVQEFKIPTAEPHALRSKWQRLAQKLGVDPAGEGNLNELQSKWITILSRIGDVHTQGKAPAVSRTRTQRSPPIPKTEPPPRKRDVSAGSSSAPAAALPKTTRTTRSAPAKAPSPSRSPSSEAFDPPQTIDHTLPPNYTDNWRAWWWNSFNNFNSIRDVEFDAAPEFHGRRIDLLKLWTVIRRPEFGGFEAINDLSKWEKLVADLGVRGRKAGKELQQLYDEILGDWDEFRISEEGLEEPEFVDVEMDIWYDTTTPAQGGSSSYPPQRSSAGTKRRSRSPSVAEIAQPPQETRAKRQRVDKGKGRARDEIPSTPDQETAAAPQTVNQLSPVLEEESENEVQTESPSFKRSRDKGKGKAVAYEEPETQDWNADTQFGAGLEGVDEEDELGPSKQLLEEHRKSDAGHEPQPTQTSGQKHEMAAAREKDLEHEEELERRRRDLVDFLDSDIWEEAGRNGVKVSERKKVDMTGKLYRATNYATDLTWSLLDDYIASGFQIEEDMGGVWTKRDDKDLKASSRGIPARLVEKHGKDSCYERRKVLKELREKQRKK